jgi:hypothetical protein
MTAGFFQLRRCLGWLLRPLRRLLIRHVPVGDPWEPVTSLLVTPQIFGPGSFRMFRWYFEGQSAVQVRTMDDVCRWLSECQYLSDHELFNENDFWQTRDWYRLVLHCCGCFQFISLSNCRRSDGVIVSTRCSTKLANSMRERRALSSATYGFVHHA